MQTYDDLIVISALLIISPALILLYARRPKSLRFIFRGNDAPVALAAAMPQINRIVAIACGVQFTRPNSVLTVFSVLMSFTAALLLWSRVVQIARHNQLNRAAAEKSVADYKERFGEDPLSKGTE
jgi:hypothetical protein